MLGILYTVIAACSYGINSAVVRRAMVSGSATTGVALTVLMGVPLFLVAALISGQLFDASDLPALHYLALVGAGIVHFVIGRYCFFRSVGIIGINRNSPFTQTSILYTVVIAIIFLSEEVNALMGAGIALVLLGPMLVPRGASESKGPVQSGGVATAMTLSRARLAEGYLFGALNGAAWGISPVLVRYALSDTGLGILGGLVSYSAAGLVLLPAVLIPANIRELAATDGEVKRWFAFSTLTIFLAQMFRYMALGVSSAILVTALLRAGEVLKLFFAYVMNREIESFERRVIVGVTLSILGGVLVVLS